MLQAEQHGYGRPQQQANQEPVQHQTGGITGSAHPYEANVEHETPLAAGAGRLTSLDQVTAWKTPTSRTRPLAGSSATKGSVIMGGFSSQQG